MAFHVGQEVKIRHGKAWTIGEIKSIIEPEGARSPRYQVETESGFSTVTASRMILANAPLRDMERMKYPTNTERIERTEAILKKMEWSRSETEQDEHWPDTTEDTYTTYDTCPVCCGRKSWPGINYARPDKYGHREGCLMGGLCK